MPAGNHPRAVAGRAHLWAALRLDAPDCRRNCGWSGRWAARAQRAGFPDSQPLEIRGRVAHGRRVGRQRGVKRGSGQPALPERWELRLWTEAALSVPGAEQLAGPSQVRSDRFRGWPGRPALIGRTSAFGLRRLVAPSWSLHLPTTRQEHADVWSDASPAWRPGRARGCRRVRGRPGAELRRSALGLHLGCPERSHRYRRSIGQSRRTSHKGAGW